MARALRLEFPGALYHVTARGNRREAIFEDDADYQTILLGQNPRFLQLSANNRSSWQDS
jgi:hypothetical protein